MQHNYGTVPSPAQVGTSQQHGSFLPAVDPVVANVAGNMLAHHGQSYLQQSQAYFQSKMGFLSGGTFLYLFAVTPQYGKLLTNSNIEYFRSTVLDLIEESMT